jgi:hypothetical protein
MSDKTKAFVVFSVGYVVSAVICFKVVKSIASKALDEEYKTLVENMRK